MIFGRKTKSQQISDLVKHVEEQGMHIEKLEAELKEKNKLIARLQMDVAVFRDLSAGTPEGCIRGEWCKACEFARKKVEYNDYYGAHPLYFCRKGDSCPNFVQKEG